MHTIFKSLVTLILFSGTFVYSLDINLGVKGGINLGTMYGDDMEPVVGMEKKLQPGMITGISLQIKPTELFCISPEILYSMKGVNMEMTFLSVTSTTRILTSYLEMPVNFTIVIPAGDVVMPKLYAGPVVGFNLTATTKSEIRGNSNNEDIKDEINGFEFSLDFGGGCDFDVGPGLVLVDLRYTLGLTTLDDDSSDPADMKNSTFSFMVGWAFKLAE